MDQLQYYLIKGMVAGTITFHKAYRWRNNYSSPYLEYSFEVYRSSDRLGGCSVTGHEIPLVNMYGTFVDIRPLLKADESLKKLAEREANKAFMKDLMASLTETETYRNE